ncbi:MAG: efflux RND transporter periplasmic adaptor subunit [Candidatus Vogelbacteria bacterium]|nr:efflux RND transporter periplasmic adaptor subunit [Candidatus Vogelbacteria bacterium]
MSKLNYWLGRYPKIIALMAIIVAVLSLIWGFNLDHNTETITVKRQDLIQTIQASGQVRAVGQVDLSFAKNGRVAQVNKQPGDRVYANEVITTLDQADLYADRQSAEATLKQNKAKVVSAKVAVADAKQALADAVTETFAEADSIMGTTIDEFYDSTGWDSANVVITFQGSSLRERLGGSRSLALRNLTAWEKALEIDTDPLVLAPQAKDYLNQLVEFIADLSFAVNYLDDLDDEAAIAGARLTINALVGKLSAASEEYRSTVADLAVQETLIDEAQAAIAKVDAEIAKGIIKAPINGLITKQEAVAGESVEANVVVTSVIAVNQDFEIEALIPEINIAKVSIGNQVKITLDALPDEIFKGTVTIVDQGETIRDGVPNFKIKVRVKTDDQRIKTGLTANLIIETAKKSNVLVVPVYALKTDLPVGGKSGRTTVKIRTGKQIIERVVTIGQIGDGGMVEIVSGLKIGEEVIITPTVE